jgi:hypothetical protein
MSRKRNTLLRPHPFEAGHEAAEGGRNTKPVLIEVVLHHAPRHESPRLGWFP